MSYYEYYYPTTECFDYLSVLQGLLLVGFIVFLVRYWINMRRLNKQRRALDKRRDELKQPLPLKTDDMLWTKEEIKDVVNEVLLENKVSKQIDTRDNSTIVENEHWYKYMAEIKETTWWQLSTWSSYNPYVSFVGWNVVFCWGSAYSWYFRSNQIKDQKEVKELLHAVAELCKSARSQWQREWKAEGIAEGIKQANEKKPTVSNNPRHRNKHIKK